MSYYRNRHRRSKSVLRFFFRLLILFIVINTIQQNLLVGVRIRGDAMAPSLRNNDTVYGFKFTYTSTRRVQLLWFRQPSRPSYGDVVYIRLPHDAQYSWIIKVIDSIVRFSTLQRLTILDEPRAVRRIIALPGDVVRMQGFRFFISPRGTDNFQSELATSPRAYQITGGSLPPGWRNYYPFSSSFAEYTVPPMRYFVAADNRFGTLDSRVWGAIPETAIIAPMSFARRFPITIKNIRRTSGE